MAVEISPCQSATSRKTNTLLFPHNPDAFYKLFPEIWIIWSWTSLVTGCPARPEYRFALRHDGMNTRSDLSDLCPISVLLLQGIAVIAHLLDSSDHPAIGSTRRRTDSDSRTNCTLRKLPCSYTENPIPFSGIFPRERDA
jgi:hypothetical protein